MRILGRTGLGICIMAVMMASFMKPTASSADMIHIAISYQCDASKEALRIVSEEKNGGNETPFKLFDSESSGLYDADHLMKPIVKKCDLGGIPFTVVINAACAVEDGTVATIAIYRDEFFSYTLNDEGGIKTIYKPFARADLFGAMCGSGQDTHGMLFNEMTIKLVKNAPVQSFSVEMK